MWMGMELFRFHDKDPIAEDGREWKLETAVGVGLDGAAIRFLGGAWVPVKGAVERTEFKQLQDRLSSAENLRGLYRNENESDLAVSGSICAEPIVGVLMRCDPFGMWLEGLPGIA